MKKIRTYVRIALFCLSISILSCYGTEWNCQANTTSGSFNLSSDCTISGGDHVSVVNTLEIVGRKTDMNDLITISAATGKRHFRINGLMNKLILRYLKLEGGDVTGGTDADINSGGSIRIHSGGGELYLYSCILFKNKAYQGGAIRSEGGGTDQVKINIYDSAIIHNVATGYMGGIGVHRSTLHILKSNISHNIANVDSGGIQVFSSEAILYNTTVSFNKADSRGGGIFMRGDMCCRKGIGQWLRENDDRIKWEKNPIARNREKVLELRKCNTLEMTINEDDLRKTEVRVEADEIGKLREELERKDRVIREKSKLVQKNYVVIAEKDKLIASKNETIQKLKAMLK